MTQEKIKRINELAKKQKEGALTEREKPRRAHRGGDKRKSRAEKRIPGGRPQESKGAAR